MAVGLGRGTLNDYDMIFMCNKDLVIQLQN